MPIGLTRSTRLALLLGLSLALPAAAGEVLLPVSQRYADQGVQEEPSFQRHVIPLLGRLGCNGRSCHGSFQGQGGFQLSLFGYDFKFDHDALMKEEANRVVVADPDKSKIVYKPTDENEHEGGERYQKGSWEYRLIRNWIAAGAKFDEASVEKLVALEITPSEILFAKSGQTVQLQAVAVWADGSREDVTPLCRFQSNSDQVAKIDENGLVTATEQGDTHVVIFYDNAVVPIPVIRPVSDQVGKKYPQVPAPTAIDKLVIQKLSKLGVVPADLSSDADFLRRVSIDMTGSLPTPREVEEFLANPSPNKRAEKIDQLLETPAYAAWWATRLCDYTGNNEGFLNNVVPIRGHASRDWYEWIYERVANNVPYDQLAAGIVLAKSREEGESYTDFCEDMSAIYRDEKSFADRPYLPHYWARTNFRMVEDRVIGFAYSFMGIRIQCAQCHKHPFDQWSKKDFEEFSGFFTSVALNNNRAASPESQKEYDEIVKKLGVGDLRGNDARRRFSEFLSEGKTIPFPELATTPARGGRTNTGAPSSTARLLGGEAIDLREYKDAREPLMAWLRDKNNRYFAPAFVNRVWANYFNVGIVEPPDDMSLANPPSNKPLLDYLTKGFIDHGFDMKWLHREIANSRTYQLSWRPNDTNKLDERNFSRAVPRRIPAEAAYDAIAQATASNDTADTMHKEMKGRAIFLASSGYRNQGNQNSGPTYALTVFGRSIRESNCDCDRSSEASLLQTVFLQNDTEVLSMIDRRGTGWLSDVGNQLTRGDGMETDEIIRQAYLRTVSRYPTADEMTTARQYIADAGDTVSGARGLLWVLINTKEFVVNH